MSIGRTSVWAAAVVLGCLGANARAQPAPITCYFTEPFVRTVFDPGRHTLTVVYDVEKRSDVERGVSLQASSPTDLRLRNRTGEVVQELKLSHHGSDGMSDRVYPYEARWTPRNDGLPQVLYGGCK